ncbi:MAG: peptidylprolyl isomerase [Thalassotalea sp.]
MKKSLLNIATLSAIYSSTLLGFHAQATIVEFDTTQGTIKVNLYDETTPTTVANFLTYVTDGSYDNTVIHRIADKRVLQDGVYVDEDFIVQGGGFYFNETLPFIAKPANSAIRNEPVWSNVAGTIAMAKTSNPNSATRQWFFNVNDNSESLDVRANSGGFTVFGQVTEGMDVLTKIIDINRCFYDSSTEIPFIVAEDKTCNNYVNGEDDNDETIAISDANFVIINAITITDNSVDTTSGLTPVLNTLLDTDGDGELNINDDDDDGDDVLDVNDLYPFDATESADTDGDGVADNTDKFPDDASETVDFDEDGTGDNADLDDDNDGEPDTSDAFPFDDSEQYDSDGDGVGDNADEFPNDIDEWRDLDKDGVGDNADACPTKATDQTDTDGDGYCNETQDKFPDDPDEYLDTDGDGIGNNTDTDDDGDGVNDDDDYAPQDPDVTKQPVYSSGSGGGSITLFGLLSLGLMRLFRK